MPARRALFPMAVALAAVTMVPVAVAQDAAGADAKAVRSEPKVEVVSRGADDRTALRYSPEPGASFVMKMSTKMSSSQSMNGQLMGEMQLPTTLFTAKMTADRVEDGLISYTMTFDEVSAEGDDFQAQQVGAMLKGMEGLKGAGVMTTRGYNKSLEFELPGGMQPMLAQQLESMKTSVGDMSAVLPEESVGEGAVWTVTSTIEQGGMKMRQVTEYTLESLRDGVVTLGVNSKQSADRQMIENEQIPAGMELELTAFDGKGSGKTSFNLGWLVPTMANITGTAKVDMKMSGPQGDADMQQSMKMEMDISGERAEK